MEIYGCETSMYGSVERTTLDNEWTEKELSENVDDECIKLLPTYEQKYKNRAMYDTNLLKPPYMAEKIKNENDLIEVYNTCYDKHRNERMFGIHWFDEWIEEQINKILKNNLVGSRK